MLQHTQPQVVDARARTKRRVATSRNVVRATTRTLELSKLGHAVNFSVYQKGHLLGRLHVGLGALRWLPARARRKTKRVQFRTVPWKVLATMMKEWPFGAAAHARLKFEHGGLCWRAPGESGPGHRMTWQEFVERMQ